MEGFIVTRWNNRREEGQKALLKWVLEVRREGVIFFTVYLHHGLPLCKGGSLVVAGEVRSWYDFLLSDVIFEPFEDTQTILNMPDAFHFTETCDTSLWS